MNKSTSWSTHKPSYNFWPRTLVKKTSITNADHETTPVNLQGNKHGSFFVIEPILLCHGEGSNVNSCPYWKEKQSTIEPRAGKVRKKMEENSAHMDDAWEQFPHSALHDTLKSIKPFYLGIVSDSVPG